MSEEQNLLIDSAEYLKTGVHIGTKFKTKYMKEFIYKTRPDGLSVLNLQKIDERLRLAVKFLANYDAKDILFTCRRENGWKGLRRLKKYTGINVIVGRYPPGILTNTNLDTFIEPKVLFVCDPWPDKNAVVDAGKAGTPVVALCDTNNEANNVDLVIPANNKGKKSVGIVLYLIAREFLRAKGALKADDEPPFTAEDFMEE